jgi:hypothetical protein
MIYNCVASVQNSGIKGYYIERALIRRYQLWLKSKYNAANNSPIINFF